VWPAVTGGRAGAPTGPRHRLYAAASPALVCAAYVPGIERGRMRDDWESSQVALLRVDARHEGAEATITVEGELDHSTVEQFRTCILEVLDTKPRSITIDAHGVTYTDSSGLSALLRAHGRAFVDQVAFRIRDPSPQLRRLVETTGTGDLLLPDE
jgi:anti-sigma B factor antagonist